MNYNLIISGYSTEDTEDIHVVSFDPDKHRFTARFTYSAGNNPSYLCKTGNILFTANETEEDASVSAYQLKASGLYPISECYVRGTGTCYISHHKQMVYGANYGSGDVFYCGINENGSFQKSTKAFLLGRSDSDTASRAHFIAAAPGKPYAYATDIGGDCIYRFPIQADGTLLYAKADTVRTPAGAGPRHIAFYPQNDLLFVTAELSMHILVFSTANGSVTFLGQTPILPEIDAADTAAGIQLVKNHVYVSVRGQNKIARFAIASDGTLAPAGVSSAFGDWPRAFLVTANEQYLFIANQRSNDVIACRINESESLCEKVAAYAFSQPTCILECN